MAFAAIAVVSSAGAAELEAAIGRYRQAIADELARGVVPCVSVAWIVDGQVVHAAGYGTADRERQVPAAADTIYRAGSISKLFNAIAVMQLVEQAKLDLDAPLVQALAEFRIANPFDKAADVTLRQLLCHRSGMIRESPVGGYLDPSQPSLASTVASVASCALVNPPNSKTRYSNVGPALAGRAVEVQSGLAYPEYQQEYILGPLGMASSAWLMNDALRPRLAHAVMRVARGDGSYCDEPAPQFELGTLPAGNLYTTAADLGKFAAWLMGDESKDKPAILRRESLATMFAVQLSDAPTGFGLGFSLGKHRNHKTVQHTGAVYGFTSSLVVLPEAKVGAIVLTSADLAGATIRRLSETALDLLLEAVRGESMPEPLARFEIRGDELARLVGHYESQSFWAELAMDGESLRGTLSGQPITLTPTGPLKFAIDSRLMHRTPLAFEQDAQGRITGFSAAGQQFVRAELARDADPPLAWKEFLGTYGPAFIPLVVAHRHGHLYATVENEYDYRLTPLNTLCFQLPPGMYADEQLVFQRDANGRTSSAVFANQTLRRIAERGPTSR